MSLTSPLVQSKINPVDEAIEIIQAGLGDMLALLENAERTAPDRDSRKIARVLLQRFGGSVSATNLLIDKLQSRPVLLIALRQRLETAEDVQEVKQVIRELGAMRIQDRDFDAGVTELYEQCHALLKAFEPPEPEQDEAVFEADTQ